ncbi:MAG TPA: CPBP family glutamic-type intramembrane protease [Phycisphaerae bacterium]|nr:CPBP family glutamic-type intramembrane protease [Phycisphaerae bacterium]
MHRYRRIWVVYRKELIDTLRDKRTLIAMILVPIVLYPALMVVLVEALRMETGRRQSEQYSVCVPSERHRAWLEGVLRREDAERQAQEEQYKQAAEAAGQEKTEQDSSLQAHLRASQVNIVVTNAGQSLWDLVSQQKCHLGVLIEPPPDPERPADTTNRVVQLIYCDTDPRSEFVYGQLARILSNESERIVRSRLSHLPQGDRLLTPLVSNSISTAGPDQQFAKILAMVIPFLLVTMTVTGAMYPAIDLTAGERERGTLETLAASPVPVGQIVAGKFGVIVTIAMISTVLNLGSMTAMVHFSRMDELVAWPSQAARKAEAAAVESLIENTAATREATERSAARSALEPARAGEREAMQASSATAAASSMPSGYSQRDYLEQRRRLEQEAKQRIGFLKTAAPVALVAMIPFAVLFSGIMLAVCSFARSFKEAQNYMMPVMVVAIIPAMVVSYMPTINLQGLMLVAPVANVVILMREFFLGRYDLAAMSIVLLSTCLYAAAAVAVAAKVYGHEAVLFGDVGSYKTLLRRRFFKPQQYPSAAMALVMLALIFPVNFYWQSYLVGADSSGERFKAVMAGAQVLIFAAPVVLLAWYRKLDMRSTFSLGAPDWQQVAGALLIAVSIVPVSLLLEQVQNAYLPPSPGAERLFARQMELLRGGSLPAVLLVFALLPGICEELAFRGFLLAGLRSKLPRAASIVLVGVIFGLYHINLEKIPIVTLMGILLAFICLRSGSIYPAMLVHIANNGLGLWVSRPQDGRVLRQMFGLPTDDSQLASVQFNVTTAVYLLVFLVGLAMVAFAGSRPRRAGDLSLDRHS